MAWSLDTVGECVVVESSLAWVTDLIAEAAGGELESCFDCDGTVQVSIEAERAPFTTEGWNVLARDARDHDGSVVLRNVCTTGFDLHVTCNERGPEFTYRWRPPARERATGVLLRSRFHLLARAALIQYPALWWAGVAGRAPLHASACAVDGSTPLVTAASGVGRSTLILRAIEDGGTATGDNLSVGDGTTVFGLAEPFRVEGGSGRRMPHGRQEMPMRERAPALEPDSVIVLRRGTASTSSLSPLSPVAAARALVTSTYAAGELRRFWAFAAAVAAGTGVGPPHPPVIDVASAFSARLPCFALEIGAPPGPRLLELLREQEAGACA
jgi:hypothetical protein